MEINSSKKSFFIKIISTIIILLLILIGISSGIYYYFNTFRNREKFPAVNAKVDDQKFLDLNFKKIISDDQKYSYFIPNYWAQLDNNINVYGDILNGSNASMYAYPNSIGNLTSDICKTFSDQAFSKMKENILYSSSNLIESKIENTKNYSGCLMNLEVTITGKNLKVKEFYIFLKNRIYQIHIQTRKEISSEDSISNAILDSVLIND